jgi:methyl-accepting chemotaxis protein
VAAKNIADLASTITSELDTIVNYAQDNAADSNKAKDLSSETEKAISHMITYLREIASATQDLAAVAEEQAASSEEIAEAVQGMSGKINDTAGAGENIRSGVADVASTSEMVAEDAETLSKLSGELQKKLSFFKLGGANLKDNASLPKKRKADLMLGA